MLMTLLWLVIGLIFLLYSFMIQDQTPAWCSLIGLAIFSCLVFLPDWPMWNRNPEVWLKVSAPQDDSMNEGDHSATTTTTSKPRGNTVKKRR
jgi:hypothetical protein